MRKKKVHWISFYDSPRITACGRLKVSSTTIKSQVSCERCKAKLKKNNYMPEV